MSLEQVVAARADNGSPYSSIPPNRSPLVGGNGGTIAKTQDTELFDSVYVYRYNNGTFASTVIDNSSTNKALSSGVFAYNNQDPVAKRLTTSLATINNDTLQSGSSSPQLVQSIHYAKVCDVSCDQGVRTYKYTKAIRDGKFNIYSGKYDFGYPQSSIDVYEDDVAATPTRSVPGLLVYKTNKPVPVSGSYIKKNG